MAAFYFLFQAPLAAHSIASRLRDPPERSCTHRSTIPALCLPIGTSVLEYAEFRTRCCAEIRHAESIVPSSCIVSPVSTLIRCFRCIPCSYSFQCSTMYFWLSLLSYNWPFLAPQVAKALVARSEQLCTPIWDTLASACGAPPTTVA